MVKQMLMMALLYSQAALSQEITVDGIRYYGDYMGKATIAAFQSHDLQGDITIPSVVYYQGSPLEVTKFERYAFSECTKIRSITVPSSITETLYDCGYEFYGCTALENFVLSPNMQVLQGTFMGCKSLKVATIPEGVLYMDAVFENCSSINNVSLPDGLREIGLECFYGCTNLEKITIPSSVESIGQNAFAFCRGLRYVTCLALVPPQCLEKRGFRWAPSNPFTNIASNATLYVPAISLESYKNTFPWNCFYKIEPCETTDIYECTSESLSDDKWFNINGQKVIPSQSGLYIHKGKKYLLHQR